MSARVLLLVPLFACSRPADDEAVAPSPPLVDRGPGTSSAAPPEPGPPTPCVGRDSSLQRAIDAADPGEELIVCPGEYRERLEITAKSLVLRSRDGASATVIDAERAGSAVAITGGADVVLEGFTFRHGAGGTLACADAGLVLRDSLVEQGLAVRGGGLQGFGCVGHVERTTFRRNQAEGRGGGLYVEDGFDILDCRFEDNRAELGGAAYVKGSRGVIARSVFVENRSENDGGGLYVYDGGPVIEANVFEGNTSGSEGGGLRVKIAEAVILDNALTDNHADWRGGGAKISHEEVAMAGNAWVRNTSDGWAGGLLLYESASRLVGETWRENEADEGGGVAILEGWGSVTIEDSVFEGNVADEEGGHLYADLPGYAVRLRRVDLVRGRAERGGALYVTETDVELENTLLEANVATREGGGAFLDEASGEIVNSLLTGNEAPEGAGLFVDDGTGSLVIKNTALHANRGGAALHVDSGWPAITLYNAFSANDRTSDGMLPVIGRWGNIGGSDPGFVDASTGDYRLTPHSLLVDAGDPAVADRDGSRSDIGLHGGAEASP